MPSAYRFQLLRYLPNRLSEEFYNIAVFLYSAEGALLDARFAGDFLRLRCNPLADMRLLHSLKEEFEERRLAGENFTAFIEDLKSNLSQGLQITGDKAFFGGEAAVEMERLERIFLATPRRKEVRPSGPEPDTRRWILGRMRQTFDLYHLSDRLSAGVPVGDCVSPRFSFQLDYAYQPDGVSKYIHALSLHRDLTDASRLCFVFERILARRRAELTAVVSSALPDDTRSLLESSQIRPWSVAKLDDLALSIRDELGL